MGDTHGHYNKRFLVVSQEEPANPFDGQLWYKPDICTTTTTTEAPVTTTTTTAEPFFMMKFDDLDNASLMIGGDAGDVADWNTFFNLPTNGTPFDSVQITGEGPVVITLYGGGGMTLSTSLFSLNEPTGTSLLEVEDNGVTVACANTVFSWYVGNGCTSLSKLHLPSCITFGNSVVEYSPQLTDIYLPQLETCGSSAFSGCPAISLSFPSLLSAGTNSFNQAASLTHIELPSLLTAGNQIFRQCSSLVYIDLSSCTNLGSSILDNGVFESISGKTIDLIIPCALMTCFGGSPDGDITALQGANTVNITYSDGPCTTTTTTP